MFSVSVFYDERIVVVAEQRPDASEEDSFQWMSRELQVSAPGVICRSRLALLSEVVAATDEASSLLGQSCHRISSCQ